MVGTCLSLFLHSPTKCTAFADRHGGSGRLDDAYEIEDGWCATPTVAAAKAETASISRTWPMTTALFASLISRSLCPTESRDPEWTVTWLEYCGYDRWRAPDTRMRSLGDVAAALLSIEGAPLYRHADSRKAVGAAVDPLPGHAIALDDRFSR